MGTIRFKNGDFKEIEQIIQMLRKKCLVTKLCLRDVFQILNLFSISTNGITDNDIRKILGRNNIIISEETQFKYKKENFKVGEKVIIYQLECSKLYGSKKRGKVQVIKDDYITVKLKNYSTSILYVTMENLEFLITKEI